MKIYERVFDDTWSFWGADTKEFTHKYHIYPAMMIPQVCRTLIEKYKPEGKLDMIFDPYCGSGTTLVEASLMGINSIGTDLNPLARLIARAKTTHYNYSDISYQFHSIQGELTFYTEDKVINKNFDRITNYSFWYRDEDLLKLSYLQQLIDQFANITTADFFNICLAETVRDVSFTRNGEFKRFRIKQQSIEYFNPNTFDLFERKVIRNMNGLKEFNSISKTTPTTKVCDFNSSIKIPSNIIAPQSIDMVITSPPYGDSQTTVAYGQFSRWANEWFNYPNAKNLDKLLMGGTKEKGERFETISIREVLDKIKALDEKRYMEVSTFLNDYWESIHHVAETIRPEGIVCYVVGNRTVKGIQIPLDYFTAEMFEKCGFKHLTTIVRQIPNKRMPAKTSPTNKPGNKIDTMSKEFLVILKKY